MRGSRSPEAATTEASNALLSPLTIVPLTSRIATAGPLNGPEICSKLEDETGDCAANEAVEREKNAAIPAQASIGKAKPTTTPARAHKPERGAARGGPARLLGRIGASKVFSPLGAPQCHGPQRPEPGCALGHPQIVVQPVDRVGFASFAEGALDKLRNVKDRLAPFGGEARGGMPNMLHPRPDFQRHLHSGRLGPCRELC